MTLFWKKGSHESAPRPRAPRFACPACGTWVEVPPQVLDDIAFLTELGFDGGRDLAGRCGHRVDLKEMLDPTARGPATPV